MEDSKTHKQCAHCNKLGELACNRCKDTHYCGKDCQKAAWSEHKHPCAEDSIEKAVLRAGWLLRKLYITSRQRASNEEMCEWQWDTEHTCLSIIRSNPVGDFKKFSPKVAVTEEEIEMIWTARHCKSAVGLLSDLLQILLQGVPVIFREVDLSLQPPKKSARLQDKGSTGWLEHCDSHHVYLVFSDNASNKRKWFIDPTGAQFGICTPVHKMDTYMKKWGRAIRTIAPLGIAKAHSVEVGAGKGGREVLLGIRLRQNQGVATAVEHAIQVWKKQTGLLTSKLLVGSSSRYKEIEPLVFNSVDDYVASYDKAAEMVKLPVDGWRSETFNLAYERLREKQERDMLKYRFWGNWP